MDKILVAIFSAFLGFGLSQAFNFISFIRRPRFRVKHWSDGVLSSYTGDPPETPWEIELGFLLENFGRNIAKNVRVFVSDIKCASEANGPFEMTSIELLELKRPIDMIPGGECIHIKLGVIKSHTRELDLSLESNADPEALGMIEADTRGKKIFSAKFYVVCDDKDSFTSLSLEFRPDKNEWASSFFEDYNEPLPPSQQYSGD